MEHHHGRFNDFRPLVRTGLLLSICVLPWKAGCASIVPSETMLREVQLPVPAEVADLPSGDRLTSASRGQHYRITPRTLIDVAFDHQPDIRSSYQQFKSEEARYDFFYVSRDSLTPQFKLSNTVAEGRADESVQRARQHTAEIGIEKLFFDTTQLNVSVGYETLDEDDEIGNQPFVSASVRYPLWASREKLSRTSEDIFRRNELNDAQLGYIQEARERLQNAMFRFYDVTRQSRVVETLTEWHEDLQELIERIRRFQGRNFATDERRLEAEIAKVGSEVRNTTGRYVIDLARFKASIGIPFHAEAELVPEPFNPFTEGTHEEWMRLSIETDPEIATLQNEVRNAEVQLDLARRGTWDIALLLDGKSGIEGRGEREGESDWSVSAGIEVSHVDPRVTDSLARQAQARIYRFKQAIIARENAIFVDTLEPIVRIETLGASREQLIGNLSRFKDDYATGLAEYEAGRLNIDDLLKRRENIFEQESQIAELTFLVGANVAELCSATGKFFELLGTGREGIHTDQVEN